LPAAKRHRSFVIRQEHHGMGSFYTNFALPGVTQAAVAAALAGRAAIVSPAVNNVVVVFDKKSDTQDSDVINSLAAELSLKCKCAVLATLNHDDDVLWCALFTDGNPVDEYNSCPAYFDDSVASDDPAGGDAAKLAAAFGVNDPAPVEQALRAPGDAYTFAMERHMALAAALNLPSFVVGGGYDYVSGGELPDGLSEDSLAHTTLLKAT
jgi:hypothetical protein